jgi:hypothetical protein
LSLPAIVEGRSYLAGMVRIAISPAAFDAIASTMPLGNVGFKPEREPDGSIRNGSTVASSIGSTRCAGHTKLERRYLGVGGGTVRA